jgi:hypothetical protein
MTPEEREKLTEAVARCLATPNIGKVSEYWRLKAEIAVEICLPVAYEDAAKIAETYDDGEVHRQDEIAAAIRARITPRNTTPTDDHSTE